MGIVCGFGYAIAVVVAADRLMLWLESRGHVNWRRRGRKVISSYPRARLDSLFEDAPQSR
ncbi:hypothetical protein [Sphaerisporangium corydalis]|uniref:Uncharacterized protein n=1 Tax=Sphaerisporangium corydalis TaxID=1441875 RepID=A0ABV9EL27_9ACTN|nr:hypothetical protein [Sphaerisporangium corydalis]